VVPGCMSPKHVSKALLLDTTRRRAILITSLFSLLNATQARAQFSPTIGVPLPSFEVASIRPNRPGDNHYFIWFTPATFTTSSTLKRLIAFAYNTNDFQISGGPGWINSETYEVDGKVPDSLVEELQKLPFNLRREKMNSMIQSLLAERFKLKVSHDTKKLPVYALLVAKNGPKLQEAKPGEAYPNGGHPGSGTDNAGRIEGRAIPISAPRGMSLAWLLTSELARPVRDQTGLKGIYDVTLRWTPDPSLGAMAMGPEGGKPANDNPPPPESSGPSIFTALEEQLGLKLESTKGPVEIIVVDHVEHPSGN
jgi:uncharacterized protein (TIGR03435 family)